MRKIKCFFLGHRWSDWEEVKNHLERECFRCPKIEAKYRKFTKYDFYGLIVKEGVRLIHRYLAYEGGFKLKKVNLNDSEKM